MKNPTTSIYHMANAAAPARALSDEDRRASVFYKPGPPPQTEMYPQDVAMRETFRVGCRRSSNAFACVIRASTATRRSNGRRAYAGICAEPDESGTRATIVVPSAGCVSMTSSPATSFRRSRMLVRPRPPN